MLDLSSDSPLEATSDDYASPSLPTLYRHPSRKKWGVGLVLQRLSDRAMVQFQDGRVRTIHADYLRKLEPVDRPYDVARGLVDALESMAPSDLQNTTRSTPEPVSLDEQVDYFRTLYPDGFQDAVYVEEHRTDGRKRPLKRHRDPLLAAAAVELTADALATHREGGPEAVHELATKLVKMTGLVAAKEARAFAEIDATHVEALADSLLALLHGEGAFEERFDTWVRTLEAALGALPSWQLATLFLGAYEPKRHCVVHPSAFEAQARWMAPGLRCGDRPMGVLYERLRSMAASTSERLVARKLAPRDLLDVSDFMWATLKPAARKSIVERRTPRPAASAADAA